MTIEFYELFPFTKFLFKIAFGMGFLQWLIPAGMAAGSWLFGGKRGGQPPDIGAPQYQMDMDWLNKYRTQSEEAIRGQTENWLEDAMRGYSRQASGRGWGAGTTSGYGEFGERAGGIASQRMSGALAQLYGDIGQMQTQARMAGMGQYGQDYQAWLQAKRQGESDWLTGLMGLMGGVDWGGMNWNPFGGGQGASQ